MVMKSQRPLDHAHDHNDDGDDAASDASGKEWA